jgi:hypothetical protein
MKKLLHIAPALPPSVNGLGDFCSILARNLVELGYDNNIFFIRNPSDRIDDSVNARVFQPNTLESQLREEDGDAIILHYAGYGYHRNGIPHYILRSLQRVKNSSRCKIIVFFHELYASSKSPWKLPFYTEPVQKYLVRQFCKIADGVFTNCIVYQELLTQITGSPNVCTGIFSNIPDTLYDQSKGKEDGMVVFGSLGRRKSVYASRHFADVIERLKIKNIYDIGPGEINFTDIGSSITIAGCLENDQIATYLNKARYGALAYSPRLLGKSGIFAAYAAFGIIPVNVIKSDDLPRDGLTEGTNYFTHRIKPDQLNLHAVRKNVEQWYATRSQKQVASKIKPFL